jgi:hypothetical protein
LASKPTRIREILYFAFLGIFKRGKFASGLNAKDPPGNQDESETKINKEFLLAKLCKM